MNSFKFSIGADPEYALMKNGAVKSAIDIVPGCKRFPTMLPNGAGLQTDNVAVEFATPVCRSLKEFVESFQVTFGLIAKGLPEGYEIGHIPSAIFPDEELQHPQAQEFGCTPDYNCWTGEKNPQPQAIDHNLRSFGGHVHIGGEKSEDSYFLFTPSGKLLTVKMCDLFLGMPSLLLDNTEQAHARRELYGKAGSYRPADYGVEYRVLSNFWTRSEGLITWVYSTVHDMLNFIKDNDAEGLANEIGGDTIQHIINTSDVDKAEHVMEQHIHPVLSEYTNDLLINELTKTINRG